MKFGLSGAVVDTLGSNSGTPLYLKPQKHVNTILRKSASRGLPALSNKRAFASAGRRVTPGDPPREHRSRVNRLPATLRRGTLEIFAVAKISMVSAPEWDELLASAHASAWASVLASKSVSKSPWRSRLPLAWL